MESIACLMSYRYFFTLRFSTKQSLCIINTLNEVWVRQRAFCNKIYSAIKKQFQFLSQHKVEIGYSSIEIPGRKSMRKSISLSSLNEAELIEPNTYKLLTLHLSKLSINILFIAISMLLQTLDLQRSYLHQGLYDKISKFMPIMKV